MQSILDKYKTDKIYFRRLNKADIPDVLSFQKENTTKDVYVDITESEFLESVELDDVIGAYCENELAGFCLLIKNRESERSLAPDINAKCSETATFDAVVVGKAFRGMGLQRTFIKIACDIAKKYERAPLYMAATVSPDNIYSKRNFLESQFKIKDLKEKYGGHMRLVVALTF